MMLYFRVVGDWSLVFEMASVTNNQKRSTQTTIQDANKHAGFAHSLSITEVILTRFYPKDCTECEANSPTWFIMLIYDARKRQRE